MWKAVIASALVAGLAACASSLGRLPPQVVRLYDEGAPGGWMEIEATRDGRVIEIEADILVEDLPPAVLAAADAELPGGRVVGAEIEIVGGRMGYEVKKTKRGREYEFVFTAEGVLLEKEIGLRPSEAPAAVLQSAASAFPDAKLKSVERIERGAVTVYHVKMLREGASYKLELDGNGAILRKVREAKAEIEIPLAD